MLPQRHRLCDRSVFQQLYKQGQRLRGRWLTVLYEPRRDRFANPERAEPPIRWAIVVSKKVSRRAADRNRIRRRLRAALRQLERQWTLGWDVIVIVKPTPKDRDRPHLLDCPFAELQQDVEVLIARAGLLDCEGREERSQKY